MNKLIIGLTFLPGLFPMCSGASALSGVFFSPGIKVGWEFGKRPGFVLGGEISTGMFFSEGQIAGAVFGFQKNLNQNSSLSYVEGEYGHLVGGVAAGVEFRDGNTYSAAPRLRLFGGLIGYGSLKFSRYSTEFDLVGKLPLPLLMHGPIM